MFAADAVGSMGIESGFAFRKAGDGIRGGSYSVSLSGSALLAWRQEWVEMLAGAMKGCGERTRPQHVRTHDKEMTLKTESAEDLSGRVNGVPH